MVYIHVIYKNQWLFKKYSCKIYGKSAAIVYIYKHLRNLHGYSIRIVTTTLKYGKYQQVKVRKSPQIQNTSQLKTLKLITIVN